MRVPSNGARARRARAAHCAPLKRRVAFDRIVAKVFVNSCTVMRSIARCVVSAPRNATRARAPRAFSWRAQ
eukprot:11200391-Lingulodinium_polyedra.AAC.1